MAYSILRESALPTGWSTTAVLLVATCAAAIEPAVAAIDLSADGAIGAEYNSNPLELGGGEPVTRGNPSRDDISTRLRANVAAIAGGDGPLHLQLEALFSREYFARFDDLNHSEHTVGGRLDWKPSQVFDVSLQASETRAPVGLSDVGGEQAAQQTSRQAQGTLRLRPTPRWQLGLTPGWRQSDLPQPGGQTFQLRESRGRVSLEFLGAGRLVPGVAVSESRGTYSDIEDATRYQQQSVEGTLNYKLSDFSTFSLAAGYTERTTHLIAPTNDPLALANEGKKPAFTGSLTIQRRLSLKTNVTVGAFRDFQQYDVGVNTSVGTGFNAGVTWAATPKLTATMDTRLTWSTISGVQVGVNVDERKDLVRNFHVGVKYLATRRVSLNVYLARTIRNSTVRSALFNRTNAGLELAASFD